MPGERRPDGEPLTGSIRDQTRAGSRRLDSPRTPRRRRAKGRLPANLLAVWFRHASVGLALSTPDLTILRANQRMEALLGLGPGGLDGRNWTELVGPVDRDRMVVDRARLTSGDVDTMPLDRMLRHADGRLVPVELSVTVLRDRDGGPRWFAAAVVHPLDHEPARTAVLRSERHLALSQRMAGLGSWDIDLRTWEAHWSEELYRLAGLSPGSVAPGGESLLQAVHPRDRPSLQAAIEEAVVGDGTLAIDVRMAEPDGSGGSGRVLALRSAIELDEHGRRVRSLGTAQDVTAQRQLERKLRLSERRFQLAFDQAPIGMALIDARPDRVGTVLKCNRALCELLDVPEAGIPPQLLRPPVEPAQDGSVHDPPEPEPLTSVRHVERTARRSDGRTLWLSVSSSLVRDDDGEPDYYVHQFVDITERKQTERAARQRTERDRHIATVLQESLLPNAPRRVGPVTVATRYQPAGTGTAVGGDWYDVFALPDGRMGLTVGDVAGHGIESAATMARLRYAVRMLAATGAGPAEVIARLNLAMHDPDLLGTEIELATLVYAQLDAATGWMRYCSAGHPPIAVLPPVCPSGSAAWLVPTMDNPPIGVTLDPGYRENDLHLPLGSTVVGFTDGLIERRDSTLDDGLSALLSTLGGLSTEQVPVEEIAATLLRELAPPGLTEDDTAVIVLRLPMSAELGR